MGEDQLRSLIDALETDIGSARSGVLSAPERYDLVAEIALEDFRRGGQFEHRGVVFGAEVGGGLRRRKPGPGR